MRRVKDDRGGGCAAPAVTASSAHGVCGGRRCGDYLMCARHRALDPLYQYRCECATVLPHLRLPATTTWFHIDRERAQALARVHDPLPRLCTWQLIRPEPQPSQPPQPPQTAE